jgi:ribonuclease HI
VCTPPAASACHDTAALPVTVYTDGVCIHGKFPNLRRAGVGVWWGEGHPLNHSAPLGGPHQTNQRAELAAVIHAIMQEKRLLHVKSDSAYVVNGCNRYLSAWAAVNWHKVKNADLWKQLHNLTQSRAPGSFSISKIKGHATAKDVRLGKVRLADKVGNDAADYLATLGALSHAPSADAVLKAELRLAVTKDVQRLMVDILVARGAHVQATRARRQQPPFRSQQQPDQPRERQTSEPSFHDHRSSIASEFEICTGGSSLHTCSEKSIITVSSDSDHSALFACLAGSSSTEPTGLHNTLIFRASILSQSPLHSGVDHPT